MGKSIFLILAFTVLTFSNSLAQAQSSGHFSFGIPKTETKGHDTENNEIVEIEAEGFGEDVPSARKDAVRNAIKLAVGELVDAKTLIEKGELVEDKILSLSNAFVEKIETIGEPTKSENGLISVKIKAAVKKGQLNERAQSIGIVTGSLSGESLSAVLFSGKERVANAEKFFDERFKDFPGNVIEAKILAKDDGTPSIEVNGEGHVVAKVVLGINMTNYTKFVNQLQELLSVICSKRESDIIAFEGPSHGREDRRMAYYKERHSNLFPIIVATPRSPSRTSWPISVYYLDSKIWGALSKTLTKTLPEFQVIEVVLSDDFKEPVCSKKITKRWRPEYHNRFDKFGTSYNCGVMADVPAFGLVEFYPNGQVNGHPEGNAFLVAPFLGVQLLPRLHEYDPSIAVGRIIYRSLNDMGAVYEIDFGEVSEGDLAAVKNFEVKVEYEHLEYQEYFQRLSK